MTTKTRVTFAGLKRKLKELTELGVDPMAALSTSAHINLKFELQYHTSASVGLKQNFAHKLYEWFRAPDDPDATPKENARYKSLLRTALSAGVYVRAHSPGSEVHAGL